MTTFVYDSDKDQRIKDLERECQQWQLKCQMLQNALGTFLAGFGARPFGATPHDSKSLPEDLLERLIAFCHPDRHENSDKANKLTQELLKLRK